MKEAYQNPRSTLVLAGWGGAAGGLGFGGDGVLWPTGVPLPTAFEVDAGSVRAFVGAVVAEGAVDVAVVEGEGGADPAGAVEALVLVSAEGLSPDDGSVVVAPEGAGGVAVVAAVRAIGGSA